MSWDKEWGQENLYHDGFWCATIQSAFCLYRSVLGQSVRHAYCFLLELIYWCLVAVLPCFQPFWPRRNMLTVRSLDDARMRHLFSFNNVWKDNIEGQLQYSKASNVESHFLALQDLFCNWNRCLPEEHCASMCIWLQIPWQSPTRTPWGLLNMHWCKWSKCVHMHHIL